MVEGRILWFPGAEVSALDKRGEDGVEGRQIDTVTRALERGQLDGS